MRAGFEGVEVQRKRVWHFLSRRKASKNGKSSPTMVPRTPIVKSGLTSGSLGSLGRTSNLRSPRRGSIEYVENSKCPLTLISGEGFTIGRLPAYEASTWDQPFSTFVDLASPVGVPFMILYGPGKGPMAAGPALQSDSTW